jgi:hypothetical protein
VSWDDEHERLNGLGHEVVDRLLGRLRGHLRKGGQDDRVPLGTGGSLESHHGARRPEVAQAGHDDADHPRLLGHEGTGRAVAAIPQLPHRLEDAVARFRGHAGGAVDHPRDGLVGHARNARDILQGRRGPQRRACHGPPPRPGPLTRGQYER